MNAEHVRLKGLLQFFSRPVSLAKKIVDGVLPEVVMATEPCKTCNGLGYTIEFMWLDRLKRNKPEKISCKTCNGFKPLAELQEQSVRNQNATR
jgi:DnaJ-class molecular chaperone